MVARHSEALEMEPAYSVVLFPGRRAARRRHTRRTALLREMGQSDRGMAVVYTHPKRNSINMVKGIEQGMQQTGHRIEVRCKRDVRAACHTASSTACCMIPPGTVFVPIPHNDSPANFFICLEEREQAFKMLAARLKLL